MGATSTDIIGWETALARLQTASYEDAGYITLTERTGGGEQQLERFELRHPSSEAEAAWIAPLRDQVLERAEAARELAIDHTAMGSPHHWRLNVYAIKGSRRIVSVGFTTHQRDPYAAPAGGIGDGGVVAATAYMSASLDIAQRASRSAATSYEAAHRSAIEQYEGIIARQATRIRELEEQLSASMALLMQQRREQEESAGMAVRAREGRAMFEEFLRSLKDLGTAYMMKEAPELAGLDPALLPILREAIADPAVARSIKDPALQRALQDPAFRRDFAAILESVADAARQVPASPPPSPT